MYVMFFFFKQKTAYEMRISDWSSDVCSSDLAPGYRSARDDRGATNNNDGQPLQHDRINRTGTATARGRVRQRAFHDPCVRDVARSLYPQERTAAIADIAHRRIKRVGAKLPRSEEHTSELQSLMRISYAVFCLQKKKQKHTPQKKQ